MKVLAVVAVMLSAAAFSIATDAAPNAQPPAQVKTEIVKVVQTEVVTPDACLAFVKKADRWAYFTTNLLVASTDTLDAALDYDMVDLAVAGQDLTGLNDRFGTVASEYAAARTRCLEAAEG